MRIRKYFGTISTVVILIISLCACQNETVSTTEDIINIRFSFWEPGMGKNLNAGSKAL